jgi:NSS family neurotransmitter:Na+ symporter
VLAPVVLGYLLISEIIAKTSTPYSGYPDWFLAIFGWGMAIALIIIGILLSLLPWSGRSHAKDDPDYDDFLTDEEYEPDPETGTIRVQTPPQKGVGE